MTVFFLFYVILNDGEESHRRTDGAYTFHFGRGIFRCAQYDEKGKTGYFAALNMTRKEKRDISLTLNMT